MRCLTLADTLRESGATCSFVCRQHSGHLLALIAQRGHRALALPELKEGVQTNHDDTGRADWLGTDWATDALDTQKALYAHMGDEPLDWLVVDHYALDARWEEALRPQAKRIMVIDDLADRPHACDLLLDQNLGRKEVDYCGLLKGKTDTLIGPQYALLRPEFAALREQSLARRQSSSQLRRLLITMGGVDKDNVTCKVLAALQSCKLPADMRVSVVMGPHAPWLAQVQAQAAQMPWLSEVLVAVDNMAQLMAASDLAIGAAGGTAWERCSLGLPSILLVLAQNQLLGAMALEKAGAAVVIQTYKEMTGLMATLRSPAMGNEVLNKLSMAAATITNGEGCHLAVEYLLEGAHA